MSPADNGSVRGAGLLASDVYLAALVARDARDHACARLFGISDRDAALVTVIGLAALADAAGSRAHQVISALGMPTSGDTLLGAGVITEGVHGIAGEWARESAAIPALILAAVVGHHLRPWLRLSLHDVRVAVHDTRVMSGRLHADFDRRYGHLLPPVPRVGRRPAPPRRERSASPSRAG